MQGQGQEKKISFKIRFVDPSKENSKPVNKVFSARQADLASDFLINKCKLHFKDDYFTLRFLQNGRDLLHPDFFHDIAQHLSKGQQQLIFICTKLLTSQVLPQAKQQVVSSPNSQPSQPQHQHNQKQTINPSKREDQLITTPKGQKQAISEQQQQLQKSTNTQGSIISKRLGGEQEKKAEVLAKSQIQQLKPSSLSNQQAGQHSQPNQQPEKPPQLGQSHNHNLTSPKTINQRPLTKDLEEEIQRQISEMIKGELNKPKKGDNEQQLAAQIFNLVQRYRQQPSLDCQIAQDITCAQCNATNFKGPVYECLICPGHLYFCSTCQSQEELPKHPQRAHPMAKIKYKSQFIKHKSVTIVDCTDIPSPDSDEQPHPQPQQQPHPQLLIGRERPQVLIEREAGSIKQDPIAVKVPGRGQKLQQGSSINNREAMENRESKQRQGEVQKGWIGLAGKGKQFSEAEKRKKLNSLKAFFNYTNAQVQKYMKGPFEYMSYEDIILNFDKLQP